MHCVEHNASSTAVFLQTAKIGELYGAALPFAKLYTVICQIHVGRSFGAKKLTNADNLLFSAMCCRSSLSPLSNSDKWSILKRSCQLTTKSWVHCKNEDE